ncbi:MAG: hypothetical protein HFE78_02370 [Clostridiales bacterium]|nr:hypothetical protein [Clostridiales bacterium]
MKNTGEKIMASMPELLAPCGSFDGMKAAVYAGADAVYFGGRSFSARMNAHNFTDEEAARGIAFCHENGVRAYAALNTQIYDRDLEKAAAFAAFLVQAGVDALIISDIGLAKIIHEAMPALALHASTQMAGHNAGAASFLAELGFCRMVCARELSFENVKALCEKSGIDIEMFVHGALCVSQSGGCLMSSIVGGRSGNRGECAQPCRLPYNGGHPLSLKDLCLAGHVTELLASGVKSLKIEGRMKSPAYVEGVVSIYRRLLDEKRNASDKEQKTLRALFSREGFTDSYFTGCPGASMLGVRQDADKQKTATAAPLAKRQSRKKPPLDIPPRGPVQLAPYRRREEAARPIRQRTARFYDPSVLPDTDFFAIQFVPLDLWNGQRRANGVLLPPVVPETDMAAFRRALARVKDAGVQHVIVSNIGQISLCREMGFCLHMDYRFNVYNDPAASFYEQYGDVMLSPELTLPRMRDIKGNKAAIVYGRLPLMTIERPMKETLLRDRRGVRFPLIKEGGRTLLLNSVPLYMADRAKELKQAGLWNQHFVFTTETKQEVLDVIERYKNLTPPADGSMTRIKR